MKRLTPYISCLLCCAAISLTCAGEASPEGEPPRRDARFCESRKLSRLQRVRVDFFHLEGNTAFSDEELEKITAPYEKREITMEELDELRVRLTRHYTDRGYINSGALIHDQDVSSGFISILIVEGRLTETRIFGNTRLRTEYVEDRLEPVVNRGVKPFNIKLLEERLKLLKEEPPVKNVHASVSPGLKPGEAVLDVGIDEAKPYNMLIKYNNFSSPGIGSGQAEVWFSHLNVTGRGDSFTAGYRRTRGFDHFSLDYARPLNRRNTTLSLGYAESSAAVVAYPFEMLDIKSETEQWSCSLRHPFYKTLAQESALGLTLEKRRGKTSLLGFPFSFTGHRDDHVTGMTLLGFSQEWMSRGRTRVLALRSDLRLGLDWLDATVHHETNPEYADSEFLAWLMQIQLFKRLNLFNSALLLKVNWQLSDDPLLSTGKFSLGGSSTVRGYRENHMTADNGVMASVEWRIPLGTMPIPKISGRETDGLVEICPFFDYGRGWNNKGADPSISEIYSAGAGLRWAIGQNFQVNLYYGYGLRRVETRSEYDLQDDGIHFEVAAYF